MSKMYMYKIKLKTSKINYNKITGKQPLPPAIFTEKQFNSHMRVNRHNNSSIHTTFIPTNHPSTSFFSSPRYSRANNISRTILYYYIYYYTLLALVTTIIPRNNQLTKLYYLNFLFRRSCRIQLSVVDLNVIFNFLSMSACL